MKLEFWISTWLSIDSRFPESTSYMPKFSLIFMLRPREIENQISNFINLSWVIHGFHNCFFLYHDQLSISTLYRWIKHFLPKERKTKKINNSHTNPTFLSHVLHLFLGICQPLHIKKVQQIFFRGILSISSYNWVPFLDFILVTLAA